MPKFEVLMYNKLFFKADLIGNLATLNVLMNAALVTISYSMFIMENLSKLRFILEASLVLVGMLQGVGAYLCIRLNGAKMNEFHSKLQRIVDEDVDFVASCIYWEVEQKCRKYAQFAAYFVFFHPSAVLPIFLYSIVCIALGSFDSTKFALPFYLVVPFDTTTIWGFQLLCFTQYNVSIVYVFCMMSIISYFVCSCYYLGALCDHFEHLMQIIEGTISRSQKAKNIRTFYALYSKTIPLMKQTIQLHVNILDVFHALADVSSGTMFWILSPSAVFMAISVFLLDQSFSNLEPEAMIYALACVIFSLLWPSLFSYFATITSMRIESIDMVIYNSIWYSYTMDLQKYTILMIARAQQPAYFSGFVMIRCTLESLVMIMKSASSYYIIFSKFAKH